MKVVFGFLFSSMLVNISNAQTPHIQWQKSLGGNYIDQANSIAQTNDGGYIVVGNSVSTNGNVTAHYGNWDIWAVKINGIGAIQWQRTLGGSNHDYATSIIQATDGDYVMAGYSFSNDSDVTGNHGIADYWIVKLDTIGDIKWQKSLGGNGNDWAQSIIQASDGNYVIAGSSYSTNGNVTGNHGDRDFWIVKIDTVGTIIWQKSLGGVRGDVAYSITQTYDGGFAVAGSSDSTSGDVTGHHGSSLYHDYWVVKLSSAGTIEWQKSLGGTNNDEACSIIQTADSGYVVAGNSYSNNGDVSGNHGGADYWILKLNSVGTLQWQKSLGGTGDDKAYSMIKTTSGGFILTGYSYSNNGNVTGNHGDADYWIAKLDSVGSIEWQKSLGGSSTDIGHSIIQATDGSFVIAGESNSVGGDVSGNHGGIDYWIVKLAECNLLTPSITLTGLATFCIGDSVSLTSSSMYNNHWSQGDTTQTIVVYSSGVYTDTVRNQIGCTASSIPITVTVNTGIVPTITQIGNSLQSSNASTYQWYLNDTLISGATGQTYITSQSGIYSVATIDVNGCPATSNQLSVIVSGIYSPVELQNVNLYIDLAAGKLYFNIVEEVISDVNIYDSNGRLVSQAKLQQRNEIDISQLSKGFYIAEIQVRDVIQRIRWLKM